ncbi:hypothetical protein EYF80_036435 [Liparis tanakae]|uniref:Uncharacterized protein n=1 Tax=Liparis tanakae TaxID=230148 RepID=A0A4Z2GIK7_9TELE|nr:hypothetical protein EYF80_036435 [Liparis tanakae]
MGKKTSGGRRVQTSGKKKSSFRMTGFPVGVRHRRKKNAGWRRQAASHLQHPRGPAEVSRLLSVSEACVWSVDMEEMSWMEGEGGRLSLLFTAAPVLREATAAGGSEVEAKREKHQKSAGKRQSGKSLGKVRPAYFGRFST